MNKLKITTRLTTLFRQCSTYALALLRKKAATTSIILLLVSANSLLFAAEETERKSRIVIFNFQMIKPEQEETARIKKPKDYSFYSIILPDTISKKLGESERFLINRDKKYLLNDKPDTIDIIKDNYSGELSRAAKQSSSDYVITGQYEIKENTLNVRIFIYNSLHKDLQEVTASEEETGIYLKNIPDSLSEGIEERIKDIIVDRIDSDSNSPLPALNNYASIGFDAGYLALSGKWADMYDNTQYYSPYISFNISSYFDLVIKFDHFSADSDNSIYTLNDYSLSVLGGSLLLGLKYQVFNNLGIYFTAGGGATRSELYVDTGEPFTESLSVEKETDLSVEAGFGLKINISSFYIRTGLVYKRIFCDEDPMDLRIVYGGAGIHF